MTDVPGPPSSDVLPPDPLPAGAAPPRPRLWPRLLLAVSLGLNLVVGGLVIGAMLRGPVNAAPPLTLLGLRQVLHELPPADREAFRPAMKDMRGEMKAFVTAMQQDREAVVTVLKAEPFDVTALRSLLDAQRSRLADGIARSTERVIPLIEAMSPEARARFAEALSKARRSRHRSN